MFCDLKYLHYLKIYFKSKKIKYILNLLIFLTGFF